MAGTQRPNDSGRRDKLDRPIKLADRTADHPAAGAGLDAALAADAADGRLEPQVGLDAIVWTADDDGFQGTIVSVGPDTVTVTNSLGDTHEARHGDIEVVEHAPQAHPAPRDFPKVEAEIRSFETGLRSFLIDGEPIGAIHASRNLNTVRARVAIGLVDPAAEDYLRGRLTELTQVFDIDRYESEPPTGLPPDIRQRLIAWDQADSTTATTGSGRTPEETDLLGYASRANRAEIGSWIATRRAVRNLKAFT